MSSQQDVNYTTFDKEDYVNIKRTQNAIENTLANYRKDYFAGSDADFVFESLYNEVYLMFEEPVFGLQVQGRSAQDEARRKYIANHMFPTYNLMQFYNICRNIQPHLQQIIAVVRYYAVEGNNGVLYYPTISIRNTYEIDYHDFRKDRANCPIPDVNFMFKLKHPFNKTVEEFVLTKDCGVLRIINHQGLHLYVRYDAWAEKQELILYQCVNVVKPKADNQEAKADDKKPKHKPKIARVVKDPSYPVFSSKFQPYAVEASDMINFKAIFADQLMVQKLYLRIFLETHYPNITITDQFYWKVWDSVVEQRKVRLINEMLGHLRGVKVVYYQIKHLIPWGYCCSSNVYNIIVRDFYTRLLSFLDQREGKSKRLSNSLTKFEEMVDMTVDKVMSEMGPKKQRMTFFNSNPVPQVQPQQQVQQLQQIQPQQAQPQPQQPQQMVAVAMAVAVVDAGVPIVEVVAPVAEAVAGAVAVAQRNQQQNQQQDQQQ